MVELGNGCARCETTGRTCPSCVQRRRYTWSLVHERGLTIEQAAEILSLPSGRVRGLIEQEADRRTLHGLKCDSIPVALTHAVIDDVLGRDPHLTLADIARWLNMRQVDFERAFLGKSKHGSAKRRVSVTSASQLMLALGRAPYELPGC
jgi:hypothetical protein